MSTADEVGYVWCRRCKIPHGRNDFCPEQWPEHEVPSQVLPGNPDTSTPTQTWSAVKDSGERQDFGTGSVRDTRTGKGRYDLLPPRAIRRLARHFENGAAKYGDRNWELGQPLSRYLDSGIRHGFSLLEGDASEDHAAAAVWNFLCFIDTAERIQAGLLDRALDDMAYTEKGGS